MAKYKVKLTLSFEYDVDVEVSDESHAEGAALNSAMDYLSLTLNNSRKFDEFWEYAVDHKVESVEKLNN